MPRADPAAGAGLLIVNADDWGLDAPTTDAIETCFRAGRITSATAMVFMADSQPAAARANELGLPVGLHLNLSQPYTAAGVPEGVEARHARLTTRFGDRGRRWRRWAPSPGASSVIAQIVVDQLREFEALYGSPPTHVDGHKHVQVSPSVARAPALAGIMLRRAFTDPPGTPAPLRVARAVRHRIALGRTPGTDRLLPLWTLREDLRAGRLPAGLALPLTDVVEVMAHPGLERELPLLMTDAWAQVLASAPLGTYADLR
ncbi:MAG: hypothetical protein JWM25_1433 [Thermoleophilia bacterium]|nr:hypothetical protein [Thermoleophilia bacterium]